MDSEQQDMCEKASRNARAIEEMLLTYDDVIRLGVSDAGDVIDRCRQIIQCMQAIIKEAESE